MKNDSTTTVTDSTSKSLPARPFRMTKELYDLMGRVGEQFLKEEEEHARNHKK